MIVEIPVEESICMASEQSIHQNPTHGSISKHSANSNIFRCVAFLWCDRTPTLLRCNTPPSTYRLWIVRTPLHLETEAKETARMFRCYSLSHGESIAGEAKPPLRSVLSPKREISNQFHTLREMDKCWNPERRACSTLERIRNDEHSRWLLSEVGRRLRFFE